MSNNPNDCYHKALPDEPKFTLLARDPDFFRLIVEWARRRQHDINCGERPDSDFELVKEAQNLAAIGARWRRNNMGKWRTP